MISKRVYVAWFGIHFFLITAVCFAGLFSLVAERATILPSALDPYARKAELLAARLLGKQAAATSPVRRESWIFVESQLRDTLASERILPRLNA